MPTENHIHCVGFHPYAHQRAVIDAIGKSKCSYKTVVVKSSRQKGKSFMIANILLYFALNWNKTKNICVSPTLKQAKNIYKTIMDAIEKTGIVKNSNATDLEITFINRSIIRFLSAEMGESLRGYTVTGILCIDECCYISDEVFNTIKPWVDYNKSPILMVSTPYVKQGFFWQYYNYGLEGVNKVITVDWCDPKFKKEMDKILPPERLEEYRKTMPANKFKSEYLGEWLDDDGTVFIQFKDCAKDVQILPNDKLFVGIDWAMGGGNDDTAVAIINDKGEQVFLDYFNNLTPTQQIDRIVEDLNPYMRQIVVIQPELNSLGGVLTDNLKERLQGRARIEGFNTTNQSKNELVMDLQTAFEQKTITILNDPKQMRELSFYTAEYNPKTKNVSYNAPLGLNDDLCIALMLAYNAYKNKKRCGGYAVSAITRK
mgnify:FL=1